MGRTRDVSKILTSNTSILSLASASSIYQTKASSGLNLINTTSFSAQTTVSINDVFSSTYENYKIVLSYLSSTGADLQLRLRVSGADETSGIYGTVRNITTIAASIAHYPNYSQNNITLGGSGTSQNTFSIECFSPFLAKRTQFFSLGTPDLSTTMYQEIVNASVKNTTSYTGFTLISTSGNITGSLNVFGYNK
jgi:hypothetical protein